MKRFTKQQFYSDRKKNKHPKPKNSDGFSCHTFVGLDEVLFDNLYPIDQFFNLLCNNEVKDEDDPERAVHILRSMVNKLSRDLWDFDSEVKKRLGDITVYRPRSSWESEKRGVESIGVNVCRAWCADEDDEDQGTEKAEAEEISEQSRELFVE